MSSKRCLLGSVDVKISRSLRSFLPTRFVLFPALPSTLRPPPTRKLPPTLPSTLKLPPTLKLRWTRRWARRWMHRREALPILLSTDLKGAAQ